MRILAVVVAVLLAAGGAEAQTRLAEIAAAGTLRVCIWPHHYAVSYRNQRTGDLEGIDIDLARALAADLGVRAVFVDSGLGRLAEDLGEGCCHLGMSAVPPNAAPDPRLAFSRPYLRSGIYAVTTRLHPRIGRWEDIDGEGLVVAVQRDSLMEGFARSAFKTARVVSVSRPQEREDEVQSGRADAFLADFPYGQRMLAFHPWARLIEPEVPVQVTPYAYAVAAGDPAWLARIDRFVETVKRDGRLATYAARHKLAPIVLAD